MTTDTVTAEAEEQFRSVTPSEYIRHANERDLRGRKAEELHDFLTFLAAHHPQAHLSDHDADDLIEHYLNKDHC